VREDIEEYRKEQADKSLSLNLAERMATLKTDNARAEARKTARLSRKKTDEKIYEITLKNLDLPDLQPLAAKTNDLPITKAQPALDDDEMPAEDQVSDPTLDETKRILADYIELLKKGPVISAAH
jgi:hypothetical protein